MVVATKKEKVKNRPVLVLCPALLTGEDLFKKTIQSLNKTYDVFVPELYRYQNMQDCAAKILKKIPTKEFFLGGISMGGYVSFEIYRQAPERVKKLILIDTNPFAENFQTIEQRKKAIEAAQKNGFETIFEKTLYKMLSVEHQNDEKMKKILTDMAKKIGLKGYINEQNIIMTRPSSVPTLSQIICPTLVVCGELDVLATPSMMQDHTHFIRDVENVLISDAGHFPPLENPKEFTAVLKKFLKKKTVIYSTIIAP